jgi:hypothetical protein
MKKETAARGSQSGNATTKAQVLRSKFLQITEVLQDATEGQLASLLNQLLAGKRNISPDIELSELEAGILIENLDSHVRERDQYDLCNVIWDLSPRALNQRDKDIQFPSSLGYSA